jgi:DNA modification methylase
MNIKPYYKTNSCALYQSDNLELMKQLPDNYIDLIYCDILYGTGKNFGDYQDLKPNRKIIEDHYISRIIEMKRILKGYGSICLQMDTKISHWIRCIADDIFGYNNFVNEIIWFYPDTPGRSTGRFPSKHDSIYWYSKSIDFTFNADAVRIPILPESKKRYETARQFVKSDGTKYEYIGGESSTKGKIPETVWQIASVKGNSKENTSYSTQKPKALLKRIILALSNPNNIVADFYMGSGTCGEVSLENTRKFIGCDIGERACKITQERLEKCA